MAENFDDFLDEIDIKSPIITQPILDADSDFDDEIGSIPESKVSPVVAEASVDDFEDAIDKIEKELGDVDKLASHPVGINEGSLTDNVDDFLKDMDATLQQVDRNIPATPNQGVKTAINSQVYEEVMDEEVIARELDKELRTQHVVTLTANPEDYLMSNLRENISEADLVLKNMLLNIRAKNTVTLPAVRTITDILRAKNETLKSISDYLLGKQKMEFDRMNPQSGKEMGTVTTDDIKVGSNNNPDTINVYIEKALIGMKNSTTNLSELLMKAQTVLDQDGNVKRTSSGKDLEEKNDISDLLDSQSNNGDEF